jgi:uncharacterized protein (DUF2147 family)
LNPLRGFQATVMLIAVAVTSPASNRTAEATSNAAEAPARSPEGLWATVDDRSGAERALVRVALADGRLRGVVEHIHLRPDEGPEPVCVQCRGERKGARIVGMTILWGHHAAGARWVGGRILDPENGREYASTLWLPDADSIKVRGHWGPFYRTQTWHRRRQNAPPTDADGSSEGVR